MKKLFALCAALCAVLAVASPLLSSRQDAPKTKTFVILYSPGPKWEKGKPVMEQKLRSHAMYMTELAEKGAMVMGGPYRDNTGGQAVITATDLAEAKKIAEKDPALAEGVMTSSVHEWYVVFDARKKG